MITDQPSDISYPDRWRHSLHWSASTSRAGQDMWSVIGQINIVFSGDTRIQVGRRRCESNVGQALTILHSPAQCCEWIGPLAAGAGSQNSQKFMVMVRFRMVKKWFPENTFFSWFFTGKAFIMVYYIIKLDLEFQLDLKNPLKQPKMWIFWKLKKSVFG